MSVLLRPFAEVSPKEIIRLEEGMATFYQAPPPEYYQLSDQSAGQYNAEQLPFHWDLIQQISSGMSILEMGCGTAHLCPYVEQRGGIYTGIDYSEELLSRNRQRFPQARFFKVGQSVRETFDLVVSLYAVEHVVNPPAYLAKLWDYCRPGGRVGIICPEFIDSPGLAPSIFFGSTPRRLREKLKSGNWIDAIRHVFDLKFSAPAWKKRLHNSPAGSFWINLRPGILNGGTYAIDTDAVHVAGLKDLIWYFESKGAEIMKRSDGMSGVNSELLRYNAYLVAKKVIHD